MAEHCSLLTGQFQEESERHLREVRDLQANIASKRDERSELAKKLQQQEERHVNIVYEHDAQWQKELSQLTDEQHRRTEQRRLELEQLQRKNNEEEAQLAAEHTRQIQLISSMQGWFIVANIVHEFRSPSQRQVHFAILELPEGSRWRRAMGL